MCVTPPRQSLDGIIAKKRADLSALIAIEQTLAMEDGGVRDENAEKQLRLKKSSLEAELRSLERTECIQCWKQCCCRVVCPVIVCLLIIFVIFIVASIVLGGE